MSTQGLGSLRGGVQPKDIGNMVIVGGVVVAGVLVWMLVTGKGIRGFLEDTIGGVWGGVIGAVKDTYDAIDPKNKVGNFTNDLGRASYTRGTGVPVKLEPCPRGARNDGLTCWKDGKATGRLNHGGVCTGLWASEKSGGLCYEKCAKGFHGIGPVCWHDRFHDSRKDIKDPVKEATKKHITGEPKP